MNLLNRDDENAKNTDITPDDDELEAGAEPDAQEAQKSAAPAVAAKPEEKSGVKKSKKEKIEKKESLLAEVRGEFKKIVWAPRRELVKQTTTVIIVSLMFGVIIFLMDTAFGFGVTNFIDLMIG